MLWPKYLDHDYVDSQLVDCGIDKLVMSKQNFANLMTQHGLKGIYSVNTTRSWNSRMSLELLNAMSTKFFSQ